MSVLGMFARHWQAGQVKTRLARDVGRQGAAELHRAFVLTLLKRMSRIADRRVLAITPDDAVGPLASTMEPGWEVVPQGPGGLGERMARFFDVAFAEGAQRAVLIGADSPNLPRDVVADALARLADVDVVLGPAEDGGYYLVGARGATPPIFDGIDFGTADVWRQTVERLCASTLRWSELPRWYDVDTLADLNRLRSELAKEGAAEPALARLRDAIDAILQ